MLELVPRLLAALFRHFVAYGDLLCDETAAAMRELRRQLLGLAVLLAAGTVAVLTGCAWVIAANWNGPYRLDAIGGLCIGFALIAAGGGWYANTAVVRGQPRPFQRLREEWREDMRHLAAIDPSLAGNDMASGTALQDTHVE